MSSPRDPERVKLWWRTGFLQVIQARLDNRYDELLNDALRFGGSNEIPTANIRQSDGCRGDLPPDATSRVVSDS